MHGQEKRKGTNRGERATKVYNILNLHRTNPVLLLLIRGVAVYPPLYKYQSIKHFTDTANPICKPATGLPYLQLGLVLDFLEWFPAGSKVYLDALRATTDGGLCRLCVDGA